MKALIGLLTVSALTLTSTEAISATFTFSNYSETQNSIQASFSFSWDEHVDSGFSAESLSLHTIQGTASLVPTSLTQGYVGISVLPIWDDWGLNPTVAKELSANSPQIELGVASPTLSFSDSYSDQLIGRWRYSGSFSAQATWRGDIGAGSGTVTFSRVESVPDEGPALGLLALGLVSLVAMRRRDTHPRETQRPTRR